MVLQQNNYITKKADKNRNKGFGYLILWILFSLLLITHVAFFVLTKKYLITSGICLYILVGILVFLIIKSIIKVFKIKINTNKLKIVICSVVIILSIVEIVFILYGYKSTYLEKRDKYYFVSHYTPDDNTWFHVWKKDHQLETSEYSFFRHVNSLGLSDEEHKVEKAKEEFRILGLGDSFTEGDGAHSDSTWLKFLERELMQQELNKELVFINAGVCGSDPFYEYVLLKEKLLKYKPDLVILMINHSDVFEVIIRGDMNRFNPDGTIKYNEPPWFEPIYATSHISRLIFNALGYDDFLIGEWGDSDKPQIAEKQIVECIRNFQELSKEQGFRFLLVIIPFKYEFERGESCMQSVIIDIDKKLIVDYINLLNYFHTIKGIGKDNYLNMYWEIDGHNNAIGYQAIADGILWKLEQSEMLDSLRF